MGSLHKEPGVRKEFPCRDVTIWWRPCSLWRQERFDERTHMLFDIISIHYHTATLIDGNSALVQFCFGLDNGLAPHRQAPCALGYVHRLDMAELTRDARSHLSKLCTTYALYNFASAAQGTISMNYHMFIIHISKKFFSLFFLSDVGYKTYARLYELSQHSLTYVCFFCIFLFHVVWLQNFHIEQKKTYV